MSPNWFIGSVPLWIVVSDALLASLKGGHRLRLVELRLSGIGTFETRRPALKMSVSREDRKSSAEGQTDAIDPKLTQGSG
jgi:hypothetical protein